jgi:hypothetical protein
MLPAQKPTHDRIAVKHYKPVVSVDDRQLSRDTTTL